MAGLHLDEWQQWVITEALAEQANRKWSAFEVAVIVSRQNGKGSILEARQLAGMFLMHEPLQVHTAHEFKTGFEHFLRLVRLIQQTPELESKVSRIRRGTGEQAIELKSGCRLRFLARTGGSGRGLSGDTVYLDEAFNLSRQNLGALLPTMSARPNPQIWYTSSAPMSTSPVLHSIRKRGHRGDSSRLFFAEWGNEEGVDVEDREAWRRANPALGIRIGFDFVAAELDALRSSPDEFARERLGVPDPLPEDTIGKDVKLPSDAWVRSVVHEGLAPDAPVTIGFEVSMDLGFASIVVAGGDQTSPYVEVIEHRRTTGWLPQRLVALCERLNPTRIACLGSGPTGALVGPVALALSEAGSSTQLEQLSMVQYRQACGAFYADVVEGRLRWFHGSGPLDLAARDAAARDYGDSWSWDIRNVSVPISPLVAATVARALLPVAAPVEPPRLARVLSF